MRLSNNILLFFLQIGVFGWKLTQATHSLIEQANKLKLNNNPQTPSEYEENQVIRAFQIAVQSNDENNINYYGNLYSNYINGKRELEEQLTKISQRAAELSNGPYTPAELKPILAYVKTTADTQKVNANNDGRRLIVTNLLEILWEAALASRKPQAEFKNRPTEAISALPSPFPAYLHPVPPSSHLSYQQPPQPNIHRSSDYLPCLYILQQLQAQHKIPEAPTANNLLDNLSDHDLKRLKHRLNNLKSDKDIFDTFFNLFL